MSRLKNTTRQGKTYDVISVQKGNGDGTLYIWKKRNHHLQETQKDTRQLFANCVWLSGRMRIEERLDERPRLQRKQNDENENKTKQKNVTPEKSVMTLANKTHKRPEYTSSRHFWLINYGEQTSTSTLALGYSLLCPALAFSAVINFAMKRSALVPPSCATPSVLGCSCPQVGVETEISEVVQGTPHPLFYLPPPPVFRT